jgi:hypothetical protein
MLEECRWQQAKIKMILDCINHVARFVAEAQDVFAMSCEVPIGKQVSQIYFSMVLNLEQFRQSMAKCRVSPCRVRDLLRIAIGN